MKRSTLYSILVLLLLAVATFFALRREGESSKESSIGSALVEYDSMSVDKLQITATGNTVILEKQGGRWMIVAPFAYRADEASVAAAVGKGRRIELTSLVSTNPEKRALFQVDSSGTFVKVHEKGTLRATFIIGKTSSSFTETYVRLDGLDDVYLADGILSSTFVKQPKEWRDKTVFKTDEGSIKAVRFTYGDTIFALTLADSLWRIGADSADQSAVRPLLSALANIQTDEFIDSTISPTPKLTAVIEVEGAQIRFHKKDEAKYLVQTSLSPQWFELQNWRTTSLLKRKKDLLPAKAG